MSPSIRPTFAPQRCKPTARFTATVILPTPPLPAPTAMTFFTCGSDVALRGRRSPRVLAVRSSFTFAAPMLCSAARHVPLDHLLQRAGGRRELDRDLNVVAVQSERP